MIKFGPEWLRNLSMEGNPPITSNTSPPPPPGTPTNQQKNAGGPPNTSSQAGPPRFQLAEYRYGREEMLALFDKDLEPPQELKDFESIYVERGHSPFALKSVNYEEELLLSPSTVASRPWPRAPGQPPRPGTLTGEATRGGRGRGRLHTGTVAAVPATYSQPQRWNELSNWRRHVVAKGEEEPTEEVWRPSESPSTTAGAPIMRYPVPRSPAHNEKWADRDWQNDRSAARSSWHASRRTGSGEMQNPDDLLPEWALEGNFTEGGTFDSHGAFHGTTDDIPSSRPANSAETAYGLTRSYTSGNIRPKEDTSGHWWVDYYQNKQSPGKREDPKKPVPGEPVVTTQNYKKLVSPFTEDKKKKSNDDSSSSSDPEMSPFMADVRSMNLREEETKVKRFYDKQNHKAEIEVNKTNNTQHKNNRKEQGHVDKENGGDVQERREGYRIYQTQKEANNEINNETKIDEPNMTDRIRLKQKYYDGANKAAVAKQDIQRAHSMFEVETKQESLNVMEREPAIPINLTMVPPPNFIPNMGAVPSPIMGQGLPGTVNPPALPNVYMTPSQQQYSMYQVQQLQQMQSAHQATQNPQKPIHNVQLPTQNVQPVQNLQQTVKVAQNIQPSTSAQLLVQNPQQLSQNNQLSPSAQMIGQNSQQMVQIAQKAGAEAQLPTQDAQQSPHQAEVPEWKKAGWTVPQTRDCPDAWFYEDPLKKTQGPFTSLEMLGWYLGGFFKTHLMVRRANESEMRFLGSLGCVPPFLSDVAQGRAGSQTLDQNFQPIIDSVSRRRIIYPPRPEPSSSHPSFIPAFSSPPIVSSDVAALPTADTQFLQAPAASALPRPSVVTTPLAATAAVVPQSPPGANTLASRPTPIANMPPQLGGDRTMPAYSSNLPAQRIVVPHQHMLPKPMFANMKQRQTSLGTSLNGSPSITAVSQEPSSSGFMRQLNSAPISTVESLWAQQPAFPWTSDLTPTSKPTSMWGDIRPTPNQHTPNVPKPEQKMDHHAIEEQMFAAARAQHLAGLSSGTVGFGQHNESISHSASSLIASLNKTEKETKVELSGAAIPAMNLPGGFKLQLVSAIEAQVLEQSKLENYNKFKPKMDEIPRLETIESQSRRLISAIGFGPGHPDMMIPNQFMQPDEKAQGKGKSDSVSPGKQVKVKAKKEDKKDEEKKTDEDKKTKRKVEENSTTVKTKKETDKPKKETEKERKDLAEKLAKEGFIEVRSSSENRQNKDKRKNEVVKEMEQKKKEEEKKAQEEMLLRQAEALKKMQQAQEMQSKQDQHLHQNQLSQHIQQTVPVLPARKAPWSAACNREGPALAEIQRLEREKKIEQMKEQQLMEQLMAQQQQVAMAKEQEMQVGWANKSLANKSSNVKSLAEIQAEEARLAQAALISREAQAREERAKMPPSEPVTVPWTQQQTLHNGVLGERVRSERPRTADVGGFWDGSVATKQEQSKAPAPASPTTSRSEPKKRTKAAKEPQEQKDAAAVTQFDTWSTDALSKWSSMIDVPTFLGFLKDIESPYEIKEYVKCYLGDSKETADFARQFLEKRYRMLRTSAPVDDLCSPAPALSPVISSEFQEVKSKSKKTKKNRMQKVDFRILGFSVTASEDRINVGDIDSV